jgi:ABC-2 type transport system permease protein
VLFAIGATCFFIGPFPGFVQAVGSAPDAVVFFVGSIFFTTAAGLQCLETFNADRGPGASAGSRRFRSLAFEPRPTFLFNPRRSRVLRAKLGAGLLAGAVFGIAGEALGFGVGYASLAGRGIDYALDDRQTALLLVGTVAATAVWGAIGVALGAILRSQVAAIIGLLAWGFVAENLLFAFLPGIGRFGPVHARDALVGLTTDHLLNATPGGFTLVAWAAALSVVGVTLAVRRDVT